MFLNTIDVPIYENNPKNITTFSSLNILLMAGLTSGVFPIPRGDNQINEQEGVPCGSVE
jgi:hypothetical protein